MSPIVNMGQPHIPSTLSFKIYHHISSAFRRPKQGWNFPFSVFCHVVLPFDVFQESILTSITCQPLSHTRRCTELFKYKLWLFRVHAGYEPLFSLGLGFLCFSNTHANIRYCSSQTSSSVSLSLAYITRISRIRSISLLVIISP